MDDITNNNEFVHLKSPFSYGEEMKKLNSNEFNLKVFGPNDEKESK